MLYPWKKDLTLCLGEKKPAARWLRLYEKWATELFYNKEKWYLRWTDQGLKSFYLDHLLAHEIGHHVDWYVTHWSKANQKQVEEIADQYAAHWLANSTKTYQNTNAETNWGKKKG